MNRVTMAVGSGGKATNQFIKDMIISRLGNDQLDNMGDAAYLTVGGELAFTTDSFVVHPEFFNGGDIGELAVFGTCNDLAVSGAVPLYLSLSIIVSEGFEISKLKKIIDSVAEAAKDVGVTIVCGDTKVVDKGAMDGIILNTAGVGKVVCRLNEYSNIEVGSSVVLTSDIARHGVAVMLARGELGVQSEIESDCGNIYELFKQIGYDGVQFARDATRGGVASVLHEIMEMAGKGVILDEDALPIREDVGYLCEMLGFEPLSVANEGVAVLIVSSAVVDRVVQQLHECSMGKSAVVVGKVVSEKQLLINTSIGGQRFIEMPSGELLPRIC